MNMLTVAQGETAELVHKCNAAPEPRGTPQQGSSLQTIRAVSWSWTCEQSATIEASAPNLIVRSKYHCSSQRGDPKHAAGNVTDHQNPPADAHPCCPPARPLPSSSAPLDLAEGTRVGLVLLLVTSQRAAVVAEA